MRRLAISDIHGCDKTFAALLDKVGFSKSDQLYLLGDYVDRGPDSAGVIQRILDLRASGHYVRCLKGNHEQMMIMALRFGQSDMESWKRSGGNSTIASYTQGSGEWYLPDDHISFLASLELSIDFSDYILVHAGLSFDIDDPLQDEGTVLWIRDWYDEIDYEYLKNKIVLHGHTPQPRKTVEEQLKSLNSKQVLNIDAGAALYLNGLGDGHLCAFDMDNKKLIFQACID